jgi:hypothetical protein
MWKGTVTLVGLSRILAQTSATGVFWGIRGVKW